MRTLIILRGASGSGKSTFVAEHNLKPYTISSDEIRLLFQSPILDINGKFHINPRNDSKVWSMFMDILESRMKRGEFIVLDATHTRSADFTKYKELVETYHYQTYCIEFLALLDVLHERNTQRAEYRIVPYDVIEDMSRRIEQNPVPGWVKMVEANNVESILKLPIEDFSHYKKIHHIGDLQGCYFPLEKYLKENGFQKDELYIFVGDFLDRGIENDKVMQFLFSIMDQPNVIFIEGNHEAHLWKWAHDEVAQSSEFETVTKPQLEKNSISKKKTKTLLRKLYQAVYYTYYEKKVLVTHGGLSTLPEKLVLVAQEQMIRGTGLYEDTDITDAAFERNTLDNHFSIHGHRNQNRLPIQVNTKCFNLEGRVEFGGDLRIVTLDHLGFHTSEIKNEIFANPTDQFETNVKYEVSKNVANLSLVQELRHNKNIYEKKFDRNISSFNFTKEVFYRKIWNDQTMKARGLFINTDTGEIVARSYEKFFNIDERLETKFEILKQNLKFPISLCVKENGYLGMLGYNAQYDEFIFATKSSLSGDFAQWFREKFYAQTTEQQRNNIKLFLKENNCTFVFEVVDPFNDPHIIEYSEGILILLDIVYREIDFRKFPYVELQKIADKFGLICKKIHKIVDTVEDFEDWYTKLNTEVIDHIRHDHVEGVVLEDSVGFMTKFKFPYYVFWRSLRTATEIMRSGKEFKKNKDFLDPELAEQFIVWIQTQDPVFLQKSIIELRNMFLKNQSITNKN